MGKMSYGFGNSMGGYNPMNNRLPGLQLPSDPNFSSVVLQLHMDGSNGSTIFTDSSSFNRTVNRVGSPTISTVQSKFGGASARFPTNGSYLSVPSSTNFNPGSGDFSIELWHNPDSVTSGATQVLVDRGLFSGFTPYVLTQFNGSLRFACSSTGSSWLVDLFSSSVLTPNSWHFIRARRRGNNFELECNGVLIASQVASGSLMTTTNNLVIGYSGAAASGQFIGYIDDLRLSMGVAREGAVPTEAFPDR